MIIALTCVLILEKRCLPSEFGLLRLESMQSIYMFYVCRFHSFGICLGGWGDFHDLGKLLK